MLPWFEGVTKQYALLWKDLHCVAEVLQHAQTVQVLYCAHSPASSFEQHNRALAVVHLHFHACLDSIFKYYCGFSMHLWKRYKQICVLLTILFCPQTLELIYLVYRGRYFYPVLLVLLSIPSVWIQFKVLHSQHSRVMTLMNEVRLTPQVQQQWVRAAASYHLVPGDIIVLQRGRALCDMVVLKGACLVMESMLSGEVSHES